MFIKKMIRTLESATDLDPVVETVAGVTSRVLPPGQVKDLLHGKQLGHALHPLLVALPIGLNVGALVLDVLGRPGDREAARRMIGTALVVTAPTAASGLADWSELGALQGAKRVGLVHAGANGGSTLLFLGSWLARRAGRHGAGTALALAGASCLAVGGYLGGHLVYVDGIGVSRNLDHQPTPKEWADAGSTADIEQGLLRAEIEDQPVVVVRRGNGELSAMGAVCSHLGGPLDQGEVEDDCLVCPWHGSRFRLEDGSVAAGPATVDQPRYDVRVVGEQVQVRAVS